MKQTIDALWKQYLDEGGTGDATDFGVWLIRKQPPIAHAAESAVLSDSSGWPKTELLAGILIGRLESFQRVSAKQALKRLGMRNPDEFALLATLFFMGSHSKSQVLRQCLMELTTGSQMLRRLKDEGLILEKVNPNDARSSLIALSAKGRKTVLRCFEALQGVPDLMGDLTLAEQQQLVCLLGKLDFFHSKVHQLLDIQGVLASLPPQGGASEA